MYDAVDESLGLLGMQGTSSDNVPAAYLNYLLFDKDMHYVDAGFVQVSSTAFSLHELTLNNVTVQQNGYIYVYVSNESNTTGYAWFDDLFVTHKHNSIVQSDDYYPFGMRHRKQFAHIPGNKDLFNNASEYNAKLEVYETMFRQYDPSTGRFNGVDALAGQFHTTTPYHFALNNPVATNDPTGLYPTGLPIDEFGNWIFDGSISYAASGGGGLFGGIGPGSGNHWSDGYRSVEGNLALMSTSTFRDFYGLIDGYGGTNYERAGELVNALAVSGSSLVTRYSIGVNYLGDGNGNIIPGTGVYHFYVDEVTAQDAGNAFNAFVKSLWNLADRDAEQEFLKKYHKKIPGHWEEDASTGEIVGNIRYIGGTALKDFNLPPKINIKVRDTESNVVINIFSLNDTNGFTITNHYRTSHLGGYIGGSDGPAIVLRDGQADILFGVFSSIQDRDKFFNTYYNERYNRRYETYKRAYRHYIN